MIDPTIFHTYDIRGVYGECITKEAFALLGKAIGTYYLRNGTTKVVIGRDNRTSSPPLTQALIDGLLHTGCDVTQLGIVTTPMVYFSWHALNSNAALMVTASHNPAEYNGLKITLHKKPLLRDQYEQIKKIADNLTFEVGTGKLNDYDIFPTYKLAVASEILLKRKLKIVLDAGNGVTGLYAPDIFRNVGCEVIELYTESDGTFPNHLAYPQKEELYIHLKDIITKEKADFGMAFDGDGDRIGIYDNLGNFIQNDLLGAYFGVDIAKKHPDSPILLNISSSLSATDYIKENGGKIILTKTGYPLISRQLSETKSVFAGEISGHFFFRDRFFNFADAIYSGLRFCELISQQKKSVNEIFSVFPKYIQTPEMRIKLPKKTDKHILVKNITDELKIELKNKANFLETDGLRFSFPDNSWGLIRFSNTESMVTYRAEAQTNSRLKEVENLIVQKLKNHNIKL